MKGPRHFLSVVVFITISAPLFAKLVPVGLRCEYKTNPLGIDVPTPRLSWYFGAVQDEQQSSYALLVSTSEERLRSLKGDVWSTGDIKSSETNNIEYAGKPLESFHRYYWRVKSVNQKGEEVWSEVAWFETAFLPGTKWTAKWINDGVENPTNDIDRYSESMPLLRRDFNTGEAVVSARLYITGVGYYESYINGERIGDHVLDPGWTAYGKEVLYSVYDVTKNIKRGANTIGVMLGNGWYNPLPIKLFGRWDLRDYQETGRPCLKAELRLRYNSGKEQVIITDQSWRAISGPVQQNSVYLGEHYDANKEVVNWNKPGSQYEDWKNAVEVRGPSGAMHVQMQPPIKIIDVVMAKKITTPGKDTFLIDLGSNFAGVVRLKVKGPRGKTINVRYGEDIFKNGRLNYATSVMTQIRKGGIIGGPGAPPTAWQEDRYTTKGVGTEVWSPRFTFHVFRYVEITGWPGTPTLGDIEGLRLSAAVEDAGQFACSNEMFNQVQEVTKRTFRSNIFSVQSDCPGREKLGYGADIAVTCNAFIYNYNMVNFYEKAVNDFANDQQADGGITETAPLVGIADRGYGGLSGPLGWQLAFPFVQKQLHDFYGDRKMIATQYPNIVRQMSFLKSKAVEGLFHWDIGDHEALDPRAEAFSAAAFYYHHALLAEEFAGILGKEQDSVQFHSEAENIKRLIVKKYLVPGTGRFDNATQAAQIFALWYKLSPEDENTFNVLMDEFKRHNWHVSTGIYGTKMMFDILRERNRNDIAYIIANQKDFPGWGYMMSKGATSLWETWQYPEIYPSQNHPMFGSISEWFYRALLGINPGSAGFRSIIIKPQPAGDLSWAKGQYSAPTGVIASEWKIEGNQYTLNVKVPGNTTAIVYVWTGENKDQSLPAGAVSDGQFYKVTVSSGQHRFVSNIR